MRPNLPVSPKFLGNLVIFFGSHFNMDLNRDTGILPSKGAQKTVEVAYIISKN